MKLIEKKGLTFLEVYFTLFLLTVGLIGLLQISAATLQANVRASREIIATSLAKSLLAEILSKDFESGTNNYGPDAGECRAGPGCSDPYDDTDDYNQTSENPPLTIDGFLMNGSVGSNGLTPDYSDFTRLAEVKYVNFLSDGTYVENPATPTDYKKVTVNITASNAKDISVSGFKKKP